VIEGWGWPGRTKKAHYFAGIKSLCGEWKYGGYLKPGELKADCPVEDACKTCLKKLPAYRRRQNWMEQLKTEELSRIVELLVRGKFVEVLIRADEKVIWINIDGVCALRVSDIGTLQVHKQGEYEDGS
jgi:hypothetical protein